MRRFTDKELMILVALADDRGHALWDLEERTGIAKGNLKQKIDSLVKKGAIYRGAARKTTNGNTSHPNDTEQLYYIVPQRFFVIREELSGSINDTQSKLRRKREMKSVFDNGEIKRLRSKLDLYEKLQSELEPLLANLRIKPPIDRIAGKVDSESSGDSGFEPGAMEQWSPAQSEIYRIAAEIDEYCLTHESAVCAVLVARPDLYAAHDKWIKEHLSMIDQRN